MGSGAFLAVVLDSNLHVKFYVDQAPHQTANVRKLGFDDRA